MIWFFFAFRCPYPTCSLTKMKVLQMNETRIKTWQVQDFEGKSLLSLFLQCEWTPMSCLQHIAKRSSYHNCFNDTKDLFVGSHFLPKILWKCVFGWLSFPCNQVYDDLLRPSLLQVCLPTGGVRINKEQCLLSGLHPRATASESASNKIPRGFLWTSKLENIDLEDLSPQITRKVNFILHEIISNSELV